MPETLLYFPALDDVHPRDDPVSFNCRLIDTIQSISWLQSGTPSNPIYTNDHGMSLLQDVRAMAAQPSPLEQRMASLEKNNDKIQKEVDILRPLKQEVASLRKDNAILRPLQQEVASLRKDNAILRPLVAVAAGIRSRFFASYRRKKNLAGDGAHYRDIMKGNAIAHDGCVITDIGLLQSGQMHSHEDFKLMYGLEWQDAAKFIGKLIDLL